MSEAVCKDYAEITDLRAADPQAIGRAWQARTTRPTVRGNGRLMIVAADHPARGALAVGSKPTAMNSRTDLLDRLRAALADPGVDGVLATADILDDLLLLGALEDKVVFSSMNRGGLAGARFELDDRMTGGTAEATAAARMNGAKMLCRIDLDDPGTVATLAACARAVDELAAHGLVAMLEPFMSTPGRRQGAQRPQPERGDQVRAHQPGPRLHVGVHLDEASGRRRDGPGDGVHHAADAAAWR